MPRNVIFVSDIFGTNQNLQTLVDDCFVIDATIIDPYQGRNMCFPDESSAYKTFLEQGGLDSYTSHLKEYIEKLTEPTIVIGFSAGASAVWKVLSNENNFNDQISHGICFYPGQIRYFTDMTPAMKTHIIFPAFESHFDLQPVVECLTNRENVSVINTDLEHGFMNKQKSIFNQEAYEHFCQFIINICK